MVLIFCSKESAWTCCLIWNLQRFPFSAVQADTGLNKSRKIPDVLTAGHRSSSLKGGAGSTLETYHEEGQSAGRFEGCHIQSNQWSAAMKLELKQARDQEVASSRTMWLVLTHLASILHLPRLHLKKLCPQADSRAHHGEQPSTIEKLLPGLKIFLHQLQGKLHRVNLLGSSD